MKTFSFDFKAFAGYLQFIHTELRFMELEAHPVPRGFK